MTSIFNYPLIVFLLCLKKCVLEDVLKISLFTLCQQDAQSYADDNSLLFMETSAKTSMNVNEIFMAIGG